MKVVLAFAAYALCFAVALYVQRRLTRERIAGVRHDADHIVHNDRVALARYLHLLAHESRRGRR